MLLVFSSLAPGPALAQTETPTSTPTPHERLFLPAVLHLVPPPSPLFQLNSSLYMQTVSPTASYNLGCQMGTRDLNLPGTQNSLAILDYGQGWAENGVWGVWNFSWAFIPASQVGSSAREFARGYYNCTASDTASRLTLAIGTNNFGAYGCEGSEECKDPLVRAERAAAHGQVWAQLVADTQQWVTNQGLGSQVSIVGANDIEQTWNKPVVARAWVNAYQANNQGIHIFYNYGSCTNCPTRLNPALQPPNDWTLEDLWYVSYGLPSAWPVPEIYNNNGVNARQWAYLSYYAVTQHGAPIHFPALMTQWQACQQVADAECETLDNTPQESHNQLLSELAYWPATRQESLGWVTDICWSGRSPACGQNLVAPPANGTPLALPPNKLPAQPVFPSTPAAAKPLPPPPNSAEPHQAMRFSGLRPSALPPISAQRFLPGNAWAGWVQGRYVQVYAGGNPLNPQQGKLIYWPDDPSIPPQVFNTESGGELRIVAEEGGLLTLRSAAGEWLRFNPARPQNPVIISP